jgi:tetratricopeptide (TPR) repeat protein
LTRKRRPTSPGRKGPRAADSSAGESPATTERRPASSAVPPQPPGVPQRSTVTPPQPARARFGARRSIFVEAAAATLAAFALTWLSFGPALHARFVSDDINAIVDNEWVTGPFDARGIATTFSWWGSKRPESRAYRPAATTGFAIDRAVFGLEPAAFRTINFVFHAACTGLVFALARGLGLALGGAAVAALLFALLPIHSEAVVWLVGRAELGAAAGFLVAALACLHYRQNGRARWLAAGAVAIAVGMAFKENAVTALAVPAIFFLTRAGDPLRTPGAGRGEAPALRKEARPWKRDVAATAALAAGVAAYALLRWSAAGPAIAPEPGSLLDNPISVVDPATRLLGALAAFGRYISLTFWPSSLSVDYSYDALGIGMGFVANADTVVALVFLAAAGAAVWFARERRSIVAAALLLAAASYSIVSNTVFVIGTILGERLFYLPTAGLSIAVAAAVEPALSGLRERAARPVAVAAAIAVAATAMIAVSRERSLDWLTPVSLFEAAVEVAPRSARAHMELGTAYSNADRLDEAVRHFGKSLEILPSYASAAYNQGNAYARARRYDEAAASYRRALETDPRFVRAWHNLALTEKLRGRTDAWLDALRGLVEVAPASTAQRTELAEALVHSRRYEEALKQYDALIEAGERSAIAYFNRGVARQHLGGCAAAVEDYRLATRAPAAPRETFAAAAGCLRELGRSDEAAALEQSGKVANRDTRR